MKLNIPLDGLIYISLPLIEKMIISSSSSVTETLPILTWFSSEINTVSEEKKGGLFNFFFLHMHTL